MNPIDCIVDKWSSVATNKLEFLLRKGCQITRVILEIKMTDGSRGCLDSFAKFSKQKPKRFPRIKCPSCSRMVSVTNCGIHPHYASTIGEYCNAVGKPGNWKNP